MGAETPHITVAANMRSRTGHRITIESSSRLRRDRFANASQLHGLTVDGIAVNRPFGG
jgi:hypothetical protein